MLLMYKHAFYSVATNYNSAQKTTENDNPQVISSHIRFINVSFAL